MKLGIVSRQISRRNAVRPTINLRRFLNKSQKRSLKLKDLNSALKPFFFMVHPDLFGNFPEKRKINENSLKKLNSFLQTLVTKKKQENEILSLKFFMRDPHQPEFDPVTEISINIGGTSPHMVVEEILKSAGLPGLLPSGHETVTKPLQRKDIHHNVHDSFSHNEDTFVSETLFTFLEQKAPLARTRIITTSESRNQSLALIEKICCDFGFKSLSVESNWRILLIHGYLKNLYAFLDRHRNEVRKAAGWKIILGTWGGIDSEGVINLHIEDEPLSWIRLLNSVDRFSALLQNVKNLKFAISQMLGGLTIINAQHLKKQQHLEDFLTSLNELCLNLNSTVGSDQIDLDLGSYKGVISSKEKTATVLANGLFLIPLSMNGSDIISFLTTSITEATNAKEIYERQLAEEEKITSLCMKRLELQLLTRSSSINHAEMTSCCKNLIDIDSVLTKGLMIKVGHIYHISADGELTIPWNWKERS